MPQVEDHVMEIYGGMSSAEVVDGFQKCLPPPANFSDLGPIPPLPTGNDTSGAAAALTSFSSRLVLVFAGVVAMLQLALFMG
jgi:hypothetical protein